MTSFKKYGGLAISIFICALAGFVGSLFEPGTWYETIAKPSFTPPDWIFPVVWPILYACMAVAAWLIWKDYGFDNGYRALKWFGLQLILNAAWSWLFFGRHAIGTALGEIMLLWIAILFTLVLFWKKSTAAGWLMAPYLGWVSYALVLNFAIWQMN